MSKRGIGWFFGLIMGTVLGVLFAPRKGKEFRKRVNDSRKKGEIGHEPILQDLADMGKDVGHVARDLYEGSELQHIVDDVTGDVKSEIDDFNEDKIMTMKKAVKDQGTILRKKVKEVKKKFHL